MTHVLPHWEDSRAWLGRHVLLLALVFLGPGFLVTSWLVGAYHATEHYLAASWYEKGEADLKAHHVKAAVEDYRAALRYARDNLDYRLRLAQAMLQAGRLDAAGADLRRIWEDEPANSVVNLELARLAVRKDESADAVRYYNNAIYGVWPTSASERRRDTQIELIDYLLASGRSADALAGLIALAADVPADPRIRIAIGERMLRAGAEADALRQFEEAQGIDPKSGTALALAGRTAFHLGRFEEAHRYLRRAQQEGDSSSQTAQLLKASSEAISLDPFSRGLSSGERVRRVRAALDIAARSFGACVRTLSSASDPATRGAALHVRLVGIAPSVRSTAARDAQVQQDTMDVVFDTEEFVSSQCPSQPVGPADVALLALAHGRRRPS